MKVSVRKGDWAIITGAIAIAVYEKTVVDDADLISNRVAVYQQRAPYLTTMVVVVTALHLLSALDPRVDPYHQAIRYFRRNS